MLTNVNEQDRTRQDRTGQDRSGQDWTGQHRVGRERTGQRKDRGQDREQDRGMDRGQDSGQDMRQNRGQHRRLDRGQDRKQDIRQDKGTGPGTEQEGTAHINIVQNTFSNVPKLAYQAFPIGSHHWTRMYEYTLNALPQVTLGFHPNDKPKTKVTVIQPACFPTVSHQADSNQANSQALKQRASQRVSRPAEPNEG